MNNYYDCIVIGGGRGTPRSGSHPRSKIQHTLTLLCPLKGAGELSKGILKCHLKTDLTALL